MTNYEKAVEIYERAGQYAVYRACEDITPHDNGTCLVCGTKHEAKNEKAKI